MYFFSETSKKLLSSCHNDLQIICNCAIEETDFSVLCGHRSEESQFALFTRGRKLVNGVWQIENKKEVVTYKDGKEKKSKHNEFPSMAVDLAPYPIDWKNEQRFFVLANRLQAHANFLFNTNKIEHRLFWGGYWQMKDLPHFELRKVKQ